MSYRAILVLQSRLLLARVCVLSKPWPEGVAVPCRGPCGSEKLAADREFDTLGIARQMQEHGEIES